MTSLVIFVCLFASSASEIRPIVCASSPQFERFKSYREVAVLKNWSKLGTTLTSIAFESKRRCSTRFELIESMSTFSDSATSSNSLLVNMSLKSTITTDSLAYSSTIFARYLHASKLYEFPEHSNVVNPLMIGRYSSRWASIYSRVSSIGFLAFGILNTLYFSSEPISMSIS